MNTQSLVDIRDISIDNTLPVNERVQSMVKQLKDPYHFKHNGVTVHVNFIGGDSLEDKIIEIYKNI